MAKAAAKEGDTITATDTHIEILPPPAPPAPIPHDFNGTIDQGLSSDVKIEGKAAATVDSTATNSPVHLPKVGVSFQKPPSNRGRITRGSSTVKINGKEAARDGDTAETCNDPSDLPVGTVKASGSVNIGD